MVRAVLGAGGLNENGEVGRRVLPDGRVLAVVPLTFGRARLYVARAETDGMGCYDDGW